MLTGSTKSLPSSLPSSTLPPFTRTCLHSQTRVGQPCRALPRCPRLRGRGGRPVPHARAARRPLGLGTANGAAGGVSGVRDTGGCVGFWSRMERGIRVAAGGGAGSWGAFTGIHA